MYRGYLGDVPIRGPYMRASRSQGTLVKCSWEHQICEILMDLNLKYIKALSNILLSQYYDLKNYSLGLQS